MKYLVDSKWKISAVIGLALGIITLVGLMGFSSSVFQTSNVKVREYACKGGWGADGVWQCEDASGEKIGLLDGVYSRQRSGYHSYHPGGITKRRYGSKRLSFVSVAYKGLQKTTKTNQPPPHAGVSVWETIAVFLGGILALAVCWRVLFLIYRRMCRSFPAFNALVQGEAPWDQPARKPARLVLVTLFSLAVALAVIASLVGAGIVVGYIGNHW